MDQEQYHSSSDFDRSVVVGRVRLAKTSETQSGGSVRSKTTDSTGMGALSPLWPYSTVSQDILSLSNGGPSAEGELVTLTSPGNYTVESLIAPCGKESSASVMSVSRELHSAQRRSHVRNLPGLGCSQQSAGRQRLG